MFKTVLKADSRSLIKAKSPLQVQDAYQVHQWLTHQQSSSRVENNLLYHVEIEAHYVTLYIQSKTVFNLRGVEEKGFVVIQANAPVSTPQAVGEKVYFQVRVLPQKYYGAQRMRITNPTERDDWFVKKCAQFGLDVLACQACQISPISFTKNNKTITEPACVYAGVAVVTDIEAVNNMLHHGFGRGKAWGAGLCMIA